MTLRAQVPAGLGYAVDQLRRDCRAESHEHGSIRRFDFNRFVRPPLSSFEEYLCRRGDSVRHMLFRRVTDNDPDHVFSAGLQFGCNALKWQFARLDLRPDVRAENLDCDKPPLVSKA